MNHFAVHLKLTQHCKSTILQYKIKNFLKNLCFSGSFVPLSLLQDFPSSTILKEEEDRIPSTFLGLCFNMDPLPPTRTAFLLAFAD